jgi:DNA-binding XRE family transcriptional regulator
MTLSRSQFAAALRMHRDRLNLTQAQAATLIGVSTRALWKWENAKVDTMRPTQVGVINILAEAKPI